MPRLKQGETSNGVMKKRAAITESILKKSELIAKIQSVEDIPKSLDMKNGKISQSSVHKWNDSNLGVIAYARNSAYSIHNEEPLALLLSSIDKANTRLTKGYSENDTNRTKNGEESKLKQENRELRVALAEVYRAYMQLIHEFREDKEVDERYRELLRKQAKALGKNKVWEA